MTRIATAIGTATLLTVFLVAGATWLYTRRLQSILQSSLPAVQEREQAGLQRINEPLKANPEAQNQEEGARLENELKRSNGRTEAATKELLSELKAQRKQAAALASAIEQQKVTTTQTAAALLFDALTVQVQQKLDQGQASEALDLAQRLTQMDSSRWEGYALAARSAAELHDFKLAADMYERALVRAPAQERSILEQQLRRVQQEIKR